MSRLRWSSAISPQPPPVPGAPHWAGGLLVSVTALACAVYLYAEEIRPEQDQSGPEIEEIIVTLGAPAQRLEAPPPSLDTATPPTEPTAPTERSEDAPPPEAPPEPRAAFPQASSDGKLSSGFGTGTQPAPPPPPSPAPTQLVVLSKRFLDISTAAYASQVKYPFESLRRREEGDGQLQVVIDRQGRVLSSTLVRSTGHERLDREMERVAQRVEQLDPLPPDYYYPTATLTIPFSFIMSN